MRGGGGGEPGSAHPHAQPSQRPAPGTLHTSGTPIFRQASKKLSTFFRDLRALSFGWGMEGKQG